MAADTIVLGDSYQFDVYTWEDDEQTTQRDLTGLQSATYTMCSADNFETPLLELVWGTDAEFIIANPTNGHILIDLRTDGLEVSSGQLHHRIELVDESGRITTVLNEYINLTIPPYLQQ